MTMQKPHSNGVSFWQKSYRTAIILAVTIVLAACATPETRVRAGLVNAGLSAPVAACMADHMVNELSLLQLKRLNDLGALKGRRIKSITMAEFIQKTRSLRDAEIVSETSIAAGKCVFG
jgi:hypothetical protein